MSNLLGHFAHEVVKERIEDYKILKQNQNLNTHVNKMEGYAEKGGAKGKPLSVENLDYVKRWTSGVQNVDPEDKVFSEFWQKWMADVASGSNFEGHDFLLEALEKMNGRDARLLLEIHEKDRYRLSRRPEKYEENSIKNLESLALIREETFLQQSESTFRFLLKLLEFIIVSGAFTLISSVIISYIRTGLFPDLREYFVTVAILAIATSAYISIKTLLPVYLNSMLRSTYVLTQLGEKLVSYASTDEIPLGQ